VVGDHLLAADATLTRMAQAAESARAAAANVRTGKIASLGIFP
jgi:hypothetical protein